MCHHYVVYKTCNKAQHATTMIAACAAQKANGTCPTGPIYHNSNAGEPCPYGCPSDYASSHL